MVRRRITRCLGLAAGGLLGAVFLPVAAAFADSYQIIPDPSSTELITGWFGLPTTPPAVAGSTQGQQVFQVVDTTSGKTVGTFDADASTHSSLYGASHELLLVTKDLSGTVGTATGDTPPVGSIIDIADYGHGYQTIYSALALDAGDVVTKTFTTPFGTHTMPAYFDAATGLGSSGLSDNSLDATPMQFTDGYYFAPAAGVSENITSVTGLPPADIAVEGDQLFNVYDAATDQPLGAFQAVVTNTSDLVFNYTEEIYVTQDISGTAGTAAGDTPPVGSLYNVFYFVGDGEYYNLYSVTPSSDGNVVSDVLVTPYGNIDIPIPYDATTAMTIQPFTVPSLDESIIPVGNEIVSGVNGVPPVDASFHGYQQFELLDASGHPIGTFDGDVVTTTGIFGSHGNYSEAILVTADSGPTGTAAGDLPPVGSVFDVVVYPGGFENITSDLVSATGPNVISETFVTPWGDFAVPTTTDLAANVADGTFFIPSWLADLAPSLMS